MTKEEIKKLMEEEIEYHMFEFDLEREEVLDVAIYNMIDRYMRDELSKEDLTMCADYLDMELNFDEIERRKEANRIRREKRKQKRLEKKKL